VRRDAVDAKLFGYMKIGLARRGYSPTGGAEAYLKRLAAALAQRGHEPILVSDSSWPASDWKWGERAVLPGKTPRVFSAAIDSSDKSWDLLFSLERMATCDVYRAGDGVHASWLERRAKFEPPWQPFLRTANPKHLEVLALERALFSSQGARKIIANSRMVADELEQHYQVPPDRITVIYNGVPPVALVCAQERFLSRQELQIPHDHFVVLFAGSGWERKGLDFALQAFANLPSPTTLIVAGKGKPPRNPPRNVRFLGPVARMRVAYATADLFLLPTLYDPFSNATLEAAAHGLPVITTAANGFHELIQEGQTGHVLTRPDAIEEIRSAIRHWNDVGVTAATRKNIANSVSHLSMDANVTATLDVLESIR